MHIRQSCKLGHYAHYTTLHFRPLCTLDHYAEKVKLSESGSSSSQTSGARTARLGSKNSWNGALARFGSDFAGASHILDF